MERKIEDISETRKKVIVALDKAAWKEELAKAFKKAASKVEIKGFRPGKAPEHLLREHVRPETVYNEAIEKCYPLALRDVLENGGFRVALQPKVSVSKLSDEELELTFELVLVPSVELGDYHAVKVASKAPSVSEEEVDASIKSLLEGEAELVSVEREAKLGDSIVFDFEGFLPEEDGSLKPFDGGKAEGYELSLGSGQFVPGFEDKMVGVKPLEEREIEVEFPKNYVKDLAGKKAVFKTKVHEVKEKKVPELTAETIKELRLDGVNDAESLRAHQKEELLKKKIAEEENRRYAEIVEKIVALGKFDIDDEILEEEAARLKKGLEDNLSRQGLKLEQYLEILGKSEEDVHKELREQGEKDLKRYLAEAKVADLEKIAVTDEDVAARVKELAAQYRMKEEEVKKVIDQHLDRYKEDLLAGKIRKFLLETCR